MNIPVIDVSGLPEQVVMDIQKLVNTLRGQLPKPSSAPVKVQLPVWEGTVLGSLSRQEIYDDDE